MGLSGFLGVPIQKDSEASLKLSGHFVFKI